MHPLINDTMGFARIAPHTQYKKGERGPLRNGTCAVPDCQADLAVWGCRGLCRSHYYKFKRKRKHVPSVSERFFSRVIPEPFSGCWLWHGSNDGGYGYGEMHVNNRIVVAHRVSYELHKGPIPKGFIVRHTCDTAPCVNPNHLILGTLRDNVRDRDERRRTAWGQRISSAKLKPQDVPIIRQSYADGMSQGEIAKEYGVTATTIGYVVRRETWKQI